MGSYDDDPHLKSDDEGFEDALALLNQLQGRPKSTKPEHKGLSGKERTQRWMTLLGFDLDDPTMPKVIHVAGSKGKGTTCFYINQLLLERQRKTGSPQTIGCYTSPHLLDIRERIQINGEKIPKPLFSYYVQTLHLEIHTLANEPGLDTPPIPGYPGFLALLGLYIFISEGIDVVVLETGIGGERDSTNIFPHPVATGITTIGLDHVNKLGSTVEEVAWHKAGIFKKGVPAFAVAQGESVLDVFRERAVEKRIVGELQVISDEVVRSLNVKISPDMGYQRLNASLAISLVSEYLKSQDPDFVMISDLVQCLENAELPGRCQVIQRGGNTWHVSVAHSEVSIKETVDWFRGRIEKSISGNAPRIVFFNQSSPRESYPLLKVLHEGLSKEEPVILHDVIFCTSQADETGKEKTDLIDLRRDKASVSSLQNQKDNGRIWRELKGTGAISIIYTIREAVTLIDEYYKGAEILVTGSTFLASGAIHVLQSSPVRPDVQMSDRDAVNIRARM